MVAEIVRVQFKADVTDLFDLSSVTQGWGFSISEGDRCAFVPIGTKEDMEKHLRNRDDSLAKLVIDAIRDATTENVVAQDLLEDALDSDEGMEINGEVVEPDALDEAKGLNGEVVEPDVLDEAWDLNSIHFND